MIDTFTDSNSKRTGRMFQLAGKKSLNISKMLEFAFSDEYCSVIISSNYSFEWCDETFMLDTIMWRYKDAYGKPIPKTRIEYDDFLLWFGGYLYKYWIDYKDVKSENLPSILEILPWERYLTGFAFYHTQDWAYVVDDAIATYDINKHIANKLQEFKSNPKLKRHYEISKSTQPGWFSPESVPVEATSYSEAVQKYCSSLKIKNKPVKLTQALTKELMNKGMSYDQIKAIPAISVRLIDTDGIMIDHSTWIFNK
jgi:hypothetical protein